LSDFSFLNYFESRIAVAVWSVDSKAIKVLHFWALLSEQAVTHCGLISLNSMRFWRPFLVDSLGAKSLREIDSFVS